MAGLIGTIEQEGFSVSVGAGRREETVTTIQAQTIKFGLVEKVDRVESATAPPGGVLERVLTFAGKTASFEPSSNLSIEVWNAWPVACKKRWKDGKSKRLEKLIPRMLRASCVWLWLRGQHRKD